MKEENKLDFSTVYGQINNPGIKISLSGKIQTVIFSTPAPELSKHINYTRFNTALSTVLFSATISAFVPRSLHHSLLNRDVLLCWET